VITEIAIFTALQDKEEALGQGISQGLAAIRQHPECRSAKVSRCLENKGRYMLVAEWTSPEAHLNDFRTSPLFPLWRSHINGLFAGTPEVFHYQTYEKE
jgi:quinol monooxygenase YgiN